MIRLRIYPTGGWREVVATDVLTGDRQRNICNAGAWSGWVKDATATPPQEYDLPLAAGVNRIRKTYYIKKQNGRAQVHFCVSFQASGFRAVTIGTLPVGYRPSETETDTCVATEAEVDVMGPATVEVLDNGTVQVYGNKPGLIGATGSIEFTATH